MSTEAAGTGLKDPRYVSGDRKNMKDIEEFLAWNGEDRFPKEFAIETIFGCNLSCNMCFIDQPTTRKKGAMPMELFKHIVDTMAPYADKFEKVDLWSLGEPLLDPHLFERIKYMKQLGYKRMAISTNADLMNADKRQKLLDTGIETVIISIDGTTKEVHEAIRRGSKFERVVENTEEVIKLRDKGGYKTRFIVRFIRQQLNWDQWDEHKAYWNARLSQEKRDFVAVYNEHNYGGYVAEKSDLVKQETDYMEWKPCHYVFESLIILSDGSLSLCPADFLEAQFGLGKVPDQTPLEAFNSKAYKDMRELHKCGNKNAIKLCKDCTILYSELTRGVGWEVAPNPK